MYIVKNISVTQAILGAVLDIPMVTGEIEKYEIPAGTQSGDQFKIKGKGFRRPNSKWAGDYIFEIKIDIPKRLTKRQRELVEELSQELGEPPATGKRRRIFS